jgi:MYXO-CTERM domain-containing protein
MVPRFARVVLAGALFGSSALADLPPDPSYVEQCTLEKQKKAGDDCVECTASYDQEEACKEKHASEGRSKRCRTSGASVWTEIWCRGGAETPAPSVAAASPSASESPVTPSPVAPPEKSGSCGACAVGASSGSDPGPWAALAVALGFALRRRRPG